MGGREDHPAIVRQLHCRDWPRERSGQWLFTSWYCITSFGELSRSLAHSLCSFCRYCSFRHWMPEQSSIFESTIWREESYPEHSYLTADFLSLTMIITMGPALFGHFRTIVVILYKNCTGVHQAREIKNERNCWEWCPSMGHSGMWEYSSMYKQLSHKKGTEVISKFNNVQLVPYHSKQPGGPPSLC